MGLRLYVGNLPFRVTADDLRATFTQFGHVTEVHIATDRNTRRPRGFAIVALSKQSEVDAAIAGLHGADFDGRALQVNEAEERVPEANAVPSRGDARGPRKQQR